MPFPTARSARIASNSPTAHLAQLVRWGWSCTVPSSAHSGRIMVLLSHGRHTNSYRPDPGRALRAAPANAAQTAPAAPPAPHAKWQRRSNGQGMWIWYVSQSDGGNLASIVAQAHAAGRDHALSSRAPTGPPTTGASSRPELVAATARERVEGVRLAVRLRQQPGRRGRTRGASGRQRSRLPGDRRRVRVRRPLRSCSDLHSRPARQDRRGLSRLGWRPSPTYTTTPHSPTPSSSARTERNSTRRRCTGRTSATRWTRRMRTRTSQTASMADRSPTRADLFQTLGRRTGALPRGGASLRSDRHLFLGLPGNAGKPMDGAGNSRSRR